MGLRRITNTHLGGGEFVLLVEAAEASGAILLCSEGLGDNDVGDAENVAFVEYILGADWQGVLSALDPIARC